VGNEKKDDPKQQNFQKDLERVSNLAFWSLDAPILYPHYHDLTAWRYEKHYLSPVLLGEYEILRPPHSDMEKQGTALSTARQQQETPYIKKIACAKIHCVNARHDQDVAGWKYLEDTFGLRGVLEWSRGDGPRGVYKGSMLIEHRKQRHFLIAKNSPYWQTYCANPPPDG